MFLNNVLWLTLLWSGQGGTRPSPEIPSNLSSSATPVVGFGVWENLLFSDSPPACSHSECTYGQD